MPKDPTNPVSSTTVRLVSTVLSAPGAPTRRMSTKSRPRNAMPRSLGVTRIRPESKYATRMAAPSPNAVTDATAAPTTPRRGAPASPKTSVGASAS